MLTIGCILGVMAAVIRGWIWSRGQMGGEGVGYAVGGILVQSGIAYLFAGRRKKRNWTKFGLIFMSLGIVFLLLELSAQSHPAKENF